MGIIGSALGLIGQGMANRTNRQIAQEANQFNLDMWNRQNEYNSPTNQMQRLQTAGLNPDLVYGSGNVSGNVTQNAPRSEVAQVKNVAESLQLPQLMNTLGQFQSLKRAKTENSILDQKLIQESYNTNIKKAASEWAEDNAWYDRMYKANKWDLTSQQAATTRLKRVTYEKYGDATEQAKKNQEVLKAELMGLDYNLGSNLKPYGITLNDPWYTRMAGTLVPELFQGMAKGGGIAGTLLKALIGL